MIKLDHDELKDLAETQLCAEHQTPVVVAWCSSEKCWTLRCGEGHYPDSLIRIPTLTEEYKQGALSEGPITENIKKRSRKKAMSNNKQLQPQILGDLPRADLATGEVLAPETVRALTIYARKYDLDPYRGHVVIMYGKPYIGLDGYLYHAFRSRKPYTLSAHPMTEGEKKDHMIDLKDHAWLAQVIFTGTDQAFGGIGIVTQKEMEAKSTKHPEQLRSPVVAAHPWQLAQKRAEWQALRRAFPIGETEEESIETGD